MRKLPRRRTLRYLKLLERIMMKRMRLVRRLSEEQSLKRKWPNVMNVRLL